MMKRMAISGSEFPRTFAGVKHPGLGPGSPAHARARLSGIFSVLAWAAAALLFAPPLAAQASGSRPDSAAESAVLAKTAELTVLVNLVGQSNAEVLRIVRENGLEIVSMDVNNTKRVATYSLRAPLGAFEIAVERFLGLGIPDWQKIETVNYGDRLATASFDLEYIAGQQEAYRDELAATDRKNESYQDIFNRARELDREAYDREKERMEWESDLGRSTIELTLSEKAVQDLDADDELSGYINMPGFEGRYFRPENPVGAVLADQYAGGTLRYMFTKGRSYFLIGVMKPISGGERDSELFVNDIVSWGVGKDFYPRYFGQGRNVFLNPFSGFEAGGMVLTSRGAIGHVFTVEPHLGLEFFKNRYVIFDARVGYLFPLDPDRVKTHRGLTGNVSLNFVF